MSQKSIQKAQWLETISDPVLFATNVLGTQLWEREIEILRSIRIHTRTAIKACHGVGKTFTLALAALWWLVRWADGIVLTTAPTFRQVGTQLWSEIHRAAGRSKIQFPDFNQTSMKLRGENNFALGLATKPRREFPRISWRARSDSGRRGSWHRVGNLGCDRWCDGGWSASRSDGGQSDNSKRSFLRRFQQ
jgi:hypothetical protein